MLALIGGTAYLFFDGHILFGIVNILLGAMAAPFIWDQLNILTDIR